MKAASVIFTSVLLMLVATTASAISDGQHFQDWRARCVDNKDHTGTAAKNCHVFQDLLHKESGNRVLHIAIGSLPDKQPLAMILTLPLGISLPPGITVRIDEKDPKQVPLQACFKEGCQAAFELEANWQKKLANGKSAEVIFYNIHNQVISIPVSLKGASAAIKALQTGK